MWGWLRHQRKFGEATEADAAGVVFLLDSSENHPGLAISGCFAIFSESLGHPPCSDARRGIALVSNFFTASPSAPFNGTGILLDGAAPTPLPRSGVFASYRFILNSSTSADSQRRKL